MVHGKVARRWEKANQFMYNPAPGAGGPRNVSANQLIFTNPAIRKGTHIRTPCPMGVHDTAVVAGTFLWLSYFPKARNKIRE